MTRWNENLVPRTAGGLSVVAAGPQDLPCVSRLFTRYLPTTAFSEHGPDAARLQAWLYEILSSHLWLVLLLRSPQCDADGDGDGDGRDQVQGFALAQYGGYEVDPEQRILRCRHLYVDPSVASSLRSASALLVDALVEAARRSPQLVDVFLITFGAQRLDALRRACERRGFRRIGTQHLGLCTQALCLPNGPRPPPRAAELPAGLRPIASRQEVEAGLYRQLRRQAEAFFRESARTGLGPIELDLDRLIAQALRPDPGGRPAALLALRDGQLAGFIAAAPAWLAPLEWRLLQSSFFYVDPAHRGGRVGLSLFEGLSRLAASHGFEGVYLGTSGEIQTPRTCRLLALRGYRHQGDVLALRLQTSAGAQAA